MGLLFLYWSMILVGYLTGTRSRSIRHKLFWVGTLLFIAIIALVFIMGVRMGSNQEVVANLGTIGLEALFITAAIMAGSVLAVTLTRRLLRMDRYGQLLSETDRDQPAADNIKNLEIAGDEPTDSKDSNGKKMTVMILAFVVLGIIFGYLFIPLLFPDYSAFETLSGNVLVVGLCFLLFFVGVDLGLSGTIVHSLKKAGLRVLAFPIAVVLGTLAAAFLCGLVLPLSQKEALAIGAGFGWYTLAPIIITEQGYVIAGAISFMHNIMRELGGIILIPIVAQKIGYIEAPSLPGVAAMDVCIPLIERACSEKIVIYSFLIGLLQSAVVPVFVPLVISL
ncbi:MAG TPA: hypothetical protein DCK81_00785 [Clostridiales bacterium UBA9856]|jgi:uncharacterized membrane protein YbjE (DUF340 family)|nr:hypothetical protein [Clostridiales bacterium UBA9856]HOA42949.1 lysine exporter LysO family protein [Bacillota bacterium]